MGRKELGGVFRRFVKESEALLTAFNAPSSSDACIRCHRLGREMCVVRLHDAWFRACEELVMASACDEPFTANGRVVPRTVSARSDVVPSLRSTFTGRSKRPSWWEPDWGSPLKLLDAAQRLHLPNYHSLSLGMTLTPNPTEDLRKLRNFFAHRNRDTAILVAGVSTSRGLPPRFTAEQLVSHRIPPGITIFEGWVRELQTMLRIAVG